MSPLMPNPAIFRLLITLLSLGFVSACAPALAPISVHPSNYEALDGPNGNKAVVDSVHHLHIVYSDDGQSTPTNSIYYLRSQDSDPVELSALGPACPTTPYGGCFQPVIAIEGSLVAVAWVARSGNTNVEDQIVYTWSVDGGETFAPAQVVYNFFDLNSPAMVINNGVISMSWRASYNYLHYAEFPYDQPASAQILDGFGLIVVPICCQVSVSPPAIAVSGGQIYVGYVAVINSCSVYPGTQCVGLRAVVVEKGSILSSWTNEIYHNVSDTTQGNAGTFPISASLDATSDGQLWFVWSDMFEGVLDISAATGGPNATGAWPSTIHVATPTQNDPRVDIIASRTGGNEEVMIAWSDGIPSMPGTGEVHLWRGQWSNFVQGSDIIIDPIGRDPTLVQATSIPHTPGIRDNRWCRVDVVYLSQDSVGANQIAYYPPLPTGSGQTARYCNSPPPHD